MTGESGGGPQASGSLRERKKARTRLSLIEAALELFERQGYEATTIDEIAAAADVSPRTFFRYFASKEQVAFGEELDAEVLRFAAARPADEPLLESIRSIALRVVDLQSEEDRVALLARLRLVYRTPALLARRFEAQAELRRATGEILAARLGRPPDDITAHVVAAAAIAAMEVAVDHWQEHGGRDDLRDVIARAVESLGTAFS